MDLRTERTYRLLFQAFSDLVGERDFDSISISELCEKAMVRRATFYRHFKNKDDFFSAYIAHIRREFSHEASDGLGFDLGIRAYCQHMTELFADLIECNETVMRRQRLSGSFDRLLGIAIDQVAKDLAQHMANMAGGAADEGLAAFYVGGLFGLARLHLAGDEPFNREAFLSEHRRITDALFAQ